MLDIDKSIKKCEEIKNCLEQLNAIQNKKYFYTKEVSIELYKNCLKKLKKDLREIDKELFEIIRD